MGKKRWVPDDDDDDQFIKASPHIPSDTPLTRHQRTTHMPLKYPNSSPHTPQTSHQDPPYILYIRPYSPLGTPSATLLHRLSHHLDISVQFVLSLCNVLFVQRAPQAFQSWVSVKQN